jgi:hypothetical protein
MFDRQRGKMGVGHKVGGGTSFLEHSFKENPVMIGWSSQSHARLVKPALHTITSLFNVERSPMQARVRANPDESVQHGPAETHLRLTAELRIPPVPCDGVMFGRTVFGIEQQIRINEDHR